MRDPSTSKRERVSKECGRKESLSGSQHLQRRRLLECVKQPIRQTTSSTVHERQERKQRDPGCNTFRCMEPNSDDNIWWLLILCDVHRRVLHAHMDLSYAT